MADLIQEGTSWLADKMKSHAGQSVTYRRPSPAGTVTVTATIGETVVQQQGYDGVYMQRVESKDFLIKAEDLILNGSVSLPADGDQIEHGGVTYQVTPIVDGEPAWRWSNGYRTVLRIHTQQIEGYSLL